MVDTQNIARMEPMLPPDGEHNLEDLAFDMATKASGLASQLSLSVRRGVGDLVRSMNCYYSNLIEGHDTHPAILTEHWPMPTIRLIQKRGLCNVKPLLI